MTPVNVGLATSLEATDRMGLRTWRAAMVHNLGRVLGPARGLDEAPVERQAVNCSSSMASQAWKA